MHKAHPNLISFKAIHRGSIVLEDTFCSLGGGFIQRLGYSQVRNDEKILLPFPIQCGVDLLSYSKNTNLSIWDIVLENEKYFRSEDEINQNISRIFEVMKESAYRGCITEGFLPGYLNVKRRVRSLCSKLLEKHLYKSNNAWDAALRNEPLIFDTLNTWISCFALAVNEENAAMGRIVTSTTNGASGVIPAVLLYHHYFIKNRGIEDVKKFLLVAGEIAM